MPHQPPNILIALVLAAALGGCSATGVAVGAGATVGVAAAQERGLQGGFKDAQTAIEVNRLLLEESTDLFGQVGVDVVEGRVLLTGSVRAPESRVTAVRLAWQAPGVREVINEIQVTDTSSLGNYARDTWISTQLKSRLLLDGEISSINYNVETVNQVVYILGLGQDQTEIQRVISHAKDIPHVSRVVSYALAKDDPARRS
ncbi:MAG: BON domain-containing protein [Kiloniellales bacterium]